MPSPLRRAAVIAIGSNSTRLLTANLDEALSEPLRGRVETRLFLALDRDNRLAPEALERLVDAVDSLRAQALAAGAERVFLTATSAVRDAHKVGALKREILRRTGLDLRVISGRQEAAWSFLGASRPYLTAPSLGVIDIGGGSTEIALGSRDSLQAALSLQLGASRLYTASPIDSFRDLVPTLAQAERVIDSALSEFEAQAGLWLLVGGTGTALLGLLKGRPLPPLQEKDEPFTHSEAVNTLEQLARLSPAQRAALPGMTPGREHILPTGLAILQALMTRLDIEQMAVTTRNNCDGFLCQLARDQGVAAADA